MADPRRITTGVYGKFNWRDGTEAGIQDDDAPCAKAQEGIGDLGDDRLEGLIGKTDAAGIGDEGRVGAVAEHGPDQRVDPAGEHAGEIVGEHLVGRHRHMEAVLLAAGPDWQDRRRALTKPLLHLVPGEIGDFML